MSYKYCFEFGFPKITGYFAMFFLATLWPSVNKGFSHRKARPERHVQGLYRMTFLQPALAGISWKPALEALRCIHVFRGGWSWSPWETFTSVKYSFISSKLRLFFTGNERARNRSSWATKGHSYEPPTLPYPPAGQESSSLAVKASPTLPVRRKIPARTNKAWAHGSSFFLRHISLLAAGNLQRRGAQPQIQKILKCPMANLVLMPSLELAGCENEDDKSAKPKQEPTGETSESEFSKSEFHFAASLLNSND